MYVLTDNWHKLVSNILSAKSVVKTKKEADGKRI